MAAELLPTMSAILFPPSTILHCRSPNIYSLCNFVLDVSKLAVFDYVKNFNFFYQCDYSVCEKKRLQLEVIVIVDNY